eukprot:5428071-Prymnesium_polylepis.1
MPTAVGPGGRAERRVPARACTGPRASRTPPAAPGSGSRPRARRGRAGPRRRGGSASPAADTASSARPR